MAARAVGAWASTATRAATGPGSRALATWAWAARSHRKGAAQWAAWGAPAGAVEEEEALGGAAAEAAAGAACGGRPGGDQAAGAGGEVGVAGGAAALPP